MSVTIKGKAGGILQLNISAAASFKEIKTALNEKLLRHKKFFEGADQKVVISGKNFSVAQKKEIIRLFEIDYNIVNVTFEDEMEKRFKQALKAEKKEGAKAAHDVKTVSKEYHCAKSVFVNQTLRGGQRVECEGDIVVLGDVNDGAEVIAGGSIAIMGTLRGLAHAGATGRNDVVVAANCLMPKQLRISGRIAVFPKCPKSEVAQIAEYKNDSIIIRPLKPR